MSLAIQNHSCSLQDLLSAKRKTNKFILRKRICIEKIVDKDYGYFFKIFTENFKNFFFNFYLYMIDQSSKFNIMT